ncbi:MAG: spore germination protein [Peptococcaceae bacterium]|nr:spore germination protein [Peptococcaceae bacterium]
MLERGKISCAQTVYLLVVLVTATAVIFLPGVTAQAAGRDAWLAPLLATLPGIYLALVIAALGKRFPGQTLIQYLQAVLGTWPGRIAGFLYFFFFVHTNSVIVREFGELLVSVVMPRTPLVVVHLVMILICAWAVRGGLEVLARTMEITFPVIIFLFLAAVILTARDMQFENLLPVLENGLKPVIKASFPPIGWRGEIILLAMFLPYLAKPEAGGRCAVLAVVFIGLLLAADAAANTAVFGPAVARMTFPTFSLVRQVSIANFLERIDAVLVAIWVMGMFGKIALFYYGAVLGAAQLANLRDHRPLVLPAGVILAALSIQAGESSLEIVEYIVKGWPPFSFTMEYFFPTLLLVVAAVRGKGGKGRDGKSAR